MELKDTFNELDSLYEEETDSLARKAFASGEWDQKRIDSYQYFYQLAKDLGYTLIGKKQNKVAVKTAKLIKAVGKEFGLDFSKFNRETSDADYYALDQTRSNQNTLRRLVAAGRPYKCEECGQGPIWNGKELTLQLHHKDGNEKNNTLDNLQILCPNCHTQTDSYARNKRGDTNERI